MFKGLILREINKQNILSSPQTPGVYIFWNKSNIAIYVGKAKNLKNRLVSYTNIKLYPKTARLMAEAEKFSYIRVGSEIESLLLEARLIRKFNSKYNIELKDDKHPLYIKITKDTYPIIKTARKVDEDKNTSDFFGPFPSSQNVKYVLRFIRRILPFSDHLPTKKKCLRSQIGLCDPCPSEMELQPNSELKKKLKKKYKENIAIIRRILKGNSTKLIKDLEAKMTESAKLEEFEAASFYKNILKKIEYINQPVEIVGSYVENPNLLEDRRSAELNHLKSVLQKYFSNINLKRIECFDIAHLTGQNPTASMVTFINGIEEKNFYRKFKIIQQKGQSDVDSIGEVAMRRLKHLDDWGIPGLIVVDGGKSQLNVFLKIYEDTNIPIIGLAKRLETIVIKNGDKFDEIRAQNGSLKLLQRIRDEAHRFARVYHHNLVTRTLLGNKKYN